MSYLLWFDDTRRAVAVKLAEATAAYERRFHAPATVALLSLTDVEALGSAATGLRIGARPDIRSNNFWIGIEG